MHTISNQEYTDTDTETHTSPPHTHPCPASKCAMQIMFTEVIWPGLLALNYQGKPAED